MTAKPLARIPRVVPFKKAVAESGLNYWSLREAHFRGELAIVRVGRAWYVEVDEIARFVQAHTDRKEVS